MSENQEPKIEQQEPAQQEQSPVPDLTLEDVKNLDLSNPESIPEALRRMPIIPVRHGVKHPLWRILLSNPFAFPKEKISRSWYNGKLITTEEYSKLPEEETFAYRNQITSSKRK